MKGVLFLSTVSIMDASYKDCHEAIEKIFHLFPLDLEGKKVVIKPNVLRSATPEEGVTTHPSVLKAVINEVVKRRPASLIVGDNPGVFSYGMNEKAFKDTGLMEVAGKYYRNLGVETVQMKINSPYIENALVSRAIIDADVYISVPKFKTHGLTGLSCAIKNNFGLLAGALKAQTHKNAGNPFNFAEALVEVFSIRVPDLVIVDGVLAMEGNGPASKDLINLSKIMASDDPVALDSVVAYMMGFPELPRTIELAAARGYGISELSRITINGKLEVIPGFKLPQTDRRASTIMDSITAVRPRVNNELCTLCETCIEHCPNGALTMEEYPVVSPELCITCFCCQELCPQKAIELK
ncbi:Iron-sulfur cluster-binding protein [Desulfosporosinus metallidurans]|uniref:Iron-sulfur cluster-binding protein n=1 Tax=Desulfosporosinus metallidurans TaxID=1888891 RepID=A0A1Q8QTZ4_9FIRM|nr:Iron-sulfur cluster-binding protein [Desulfosporosinus metallidurans]